MLKIWGRTNSVNVKKALWCVEELGLPYERADAGMQYGVVNTPEYRRMNPNGLVPTMDEDGFILWESHSIVRYLSAKYGKRARRLLGADPHAAREPRCEGDRSGAREVRGDGAHARRRARRQALRRRAFFYG
jgi:glutathione S-transferase